MEIDSANYVVESAEMKSDEERVILVDNTVPSVDSWNMANNERQTVKVSGFQPD